MGGNTRTDPANTEQRGDALSQTGAPRAPRVGKASFSLAAKKGVATPRGPRPLKGPSATPR